MTETVKSNQDDTKREPMTSSKSSPKVLKPSNDGHEPSKQPEKPEKPLTKVVVRRLPPTMTLESFVDQVSPLPPVDYMYFVKADSTLAPNSFCRAYLHFVNVQDLLIFTEKFDNYVFLDNKGNEFPAIVEYAPFQRIPKQRSSRKKDPRTGTIENDPYYQEFVEALKVEEAQRKAASKTNKQHFFETPTGTTTPQKMTSTPLLEYLKLRRAEKLRLRDEREKERKKKDIDKRNTRISSRLPKVSEDDGESAQNKVSGSGIDAGEAKRPVKETIIKRREEERIRVRERERKDRGKESKDHRQDARDHRNISDHQDQGRDQRREQRRDHRERESGVEAEKERHQSQDKDENRPKELRKGGKSYQEERQRLNERRQAAKNVISKNANSSMTDVSEKEEKSVDDAQEDGADKKAPLRKTEYTPRMYEKSKSDQGRLQINKENRKSERPNKSDLKDADLRRGHESKGFDGRKNEDRYRKVSQESLDKVESRKSLAKAENRRYEKHPGEINKTVVEKTHNKDVKSEMNAKLPSKEEVRKKSYNMEREQRRTMDRKIPVKKESNNKSDEKISFTKEVVSSKSDSSPTVKTKVNDDKQREKEQQGASGDHTVSGRRSVNNTKKNLDPELELSRRKSAAAVGTHEQDDENTRESTRDVDSQKKTGTRNEGDKKDPRAERRIRNKDRPSIEIYRPGMGRFSRQRLEREKGLTKERESASSSPSPVSNASQRADSQEK